jgi:hypothetical protein
MPTAGVSIIVIVIVLFIAIGCRRLLRFGRRPRAAYRVEAPPRYPFAVGLQLRFAATAAAPVVRLRTAAVAVGHGVESRSSGPGAAISDPYPRHGVKRCGALPVASSCSPPSGHHRRGLRRRSSGGGAEGGRGSNASVLRYLRPRSVIKRPRGQSDLKNPLQCLYLLKTFGVASHSTGRRFSVSYCQFRVHFTFPR